MDQTFPFNEKKTLFPQTILLYKSDRIEKD